MTSERKTVYDFTVKDNKNNDVSLREYAGKVLLIVNTASKCGFTPQFDGLEKIFQMYKERGLVVLGFPCNQFANQDPGSEDEIESFCRLNYGVSFPIMAKVKVNGDDAAELFKFLKQSLPGFLGLEAVKWNFSKFLVDRKGKPVKRYAPNEDMLKYQEDIQGLL